MRPTVAFIATYDTKGAESEYIKEKIIEYGADCVTIDAGVGRPPTQRPDVSLAKLCGGEKAEAAVRALPRGEAVAFVSALVEDYVSRLAGGGAIDAVIGVGGAGGTQIVTQAMRALPFGLPKLMLSTLASGNTRWYLEDSDIEMIPSITDIAGLSGISKLVYDRFAAGAAAQARWHSEWYAAHRREIYEYTPFLVGQTMYGTTTGGVTEARNALEDAGYESVVFLESGAGGRSMERFIREGAIHGALDMTLAEIGAHLVGGLHDAGPGRLSAAVEMDIPLVIVPGGADTVVLPPMDALSAKFKRGRTLNFHNPTMTTMRTSVRENIKIGRFISKKLENASSPVKLFFPKGGLSSIDRPGAVFYLPEANEALLDTLKRGLKGSLVEVIEDERHLYDPGFGRDAARMLMELAGARKR